MISLFIIYTSWYLKSEQQNSTDVEIRIQNARKRLSREAGVDIPDIKEMRFERKKANLDRARRIKQSNKFRYAP